MLRLVLTCPTLRSSSISDVIEVCEIAPIMSADETMVWMEIVDLEFDVLKPSKEDLNMIDEILHFALIDGGDSSGTFYLRKEPDGSLEFEWNVDEEEILRRPAGSNQNRIPLLGPSNLYHEIHFKAGYLVRDKDNVKEEVVIERCKLPHINHFSNQEIELS